MTNITKDQLYKRLTRKYGKILTDIFIRYTIIDNDIKTAEQIISDSYKEECKYNEIHKNKQD